MTETSIKKYSAQFLNKSFADGKDTYTFIMTTNEVDRDGEIIETRGIDYTKFMQNPVVPNMHKSYDKPVGQWLRIWIETDRGVDRMLGEMFFHELDDDSKEMKMYADAGILRTVSVGFIPLECEDMPIIENGVTTNKYRRVIKKSELLECSLVWIPANGSAIRVKALELKESNQITDKQFNQIIEAITMPENEIETKEISTIEEKVGASISSANKAKIKSAYDAMQTAVKALSDMLGEPDEDEDENPFKSVNTELIAEIKTLVRSEFERNMNLLEIAIEKSNIDKGGCDCNHDTKGSELKPISKIELMNIIKDK